MKTWRILLAVIVIFAAGAVTGAIAMRRIAPVIVKKEQSNHPGPGFPDKRKEYVDRLDAKLKLTPQQKGKIETILAQSQDRMKQIWQEFEPQTKDEYRRTRKEISEVLNPEQLEIYQKMRRDREKKGNDGKPGNKAEGHDDKSKKPC